MYININKTFNQIKKYLADSTDLCKAYESTLRLQSQLLALIYDAEAFSAPAGQERLANSNSFGQCNNGTVTLVLEEPLPSMKRLTEAVEEHWKAMIHAAISKAAQQESLPYFEKTMDLPKYHGETGLDKNILLPWTVIGWDMQRSNDPGSAIQGEVL